MIRFKLLGVIAVTFLTLGALFILHPSHAAACPGSPPWDGNVGYSRDGWCGYFTGTFNPNGSGCGAAAGPVICRGIPSSVDSIATLKSFLQNDIQRGSTEDQTGSDFIVHTMLGEDYNQVASRNPMNSGEWNQLVSDLNAFGNITDGSGGKSTGTSGYVIWHDVRPLYCSNSAPSQDGNCAGCYRTSNNFGVNSYYIPTINDDAMFWTTNASDPKCSSSNPNTWVDLIDFYDTNNDTVYMLKRNCGNPIGAFSGLPRPPSGSFNLHPAVNPTITTPSGTTVGGNVAQVGDKVTFNYSVFNSGSTDSGAINCTDMSSPLIVNGYYTYPNPPDIGTNNFGCSIRAQQNSSEGAISMTVSTANQTVCASMYVNPSRPGGGPLGAEACVLVAAEPYVKAFGGDVSAGNAQASSVCNTSNDYAAGIVSWNTDSGLYSGAGTQLAAFAIGDIEQFATAQTNTGASNAVAPSGLSFANTPIVPGTYGGNLGANSLPCMNDYYVVPSGAQPLGGSNVDLSTLSSGAYTYSGGGTLTLHGSLSSSADSASTARVQIFVNGGTNVYIPSNITYQDSPASWGSISDIPMLELVVQSGNIYVSNNATELDGTYVAQNSNADGKGTGGQIATCATSSGPWPTGNGPGSTLAASCGSHLLVNGAFVADDVALERSFSTLSSSGGDNPSSLTSSAAEQFDYGPSDWLVQPPAPPEALTYNTIVDLPPVL